MINGGISAKITAKWKFFVLLPPYLGIMPGDMGLRTGIRPH